MGYRPLRLSPLKKPRAYYRYRHPRDSSRSRYACEGNRFITDADL
jgi:hypothetical protein